MRRTARPEIGLVSLLCLVLLCASCSTSDQQARLDENADRIAELEAALNQATSTSRPPTATTSTSTITTSTVPPFVPLPVASGSFVGVSDLSPLTVDRSFPGVWGSSIPDPDVAVGRERILIATNAMVALLDKHGDVVVSGELGDMFGDTPGLEDASNGVAVFDPRTLYDARSERFFLLASARNGDYNSKFALAVSRSSVPGSLGLNDWYFYAFDAQFVYGEDLRRHVDFTSIGTFPGYVTLVAQMEPLFEVANATLMVHILPTAPLVAGELPEAWATIYPLYPLPGRNLDLAYAQPVIQFDDSDVAFLVAPSWSGCDLAVVGISPGDPPLIRTALAAAPGECKRPEAGSPQPGGFGAVDLLATMISNRPVLVNGSIWGAQAVEVELTSGAYPAIRWFQIDISNWPNSVAYVQNATLAADGYGLFYPSVTVNSSNDMALVFGRSGSTEYPSLYVTGRLGGDPLGTLRPAIQLVAGQAPLDNWHRGRNRFGDYFGISLDPVDESAWAFGEYTAGPCETGTWVGHLEWVEDVETRTVAEPLAVTSSPPCEREDTSDTTMAAMEFDGSVCISEGPEVGGSRLECLGAFDDPELGLVFSFRVHGFTFADQAGAVLDNIDARSNCGREDWGRFQQEAGQIMWIRVRNGGDCSVELRLPGGAVSSSVRVTG